MKLKNQELKATLGFIRVIRATRVQISVLTMFIISAADPTPPLPFSVLSVSSVRDKLLTPSFAFGFYQRQLTPNCF
jgi:hypothetical protein